LTLWTSSDSGEPEAAPAAEAPKEEKVESTEAKSDAVEPGTEAAPATES